MIPGRRLTRPVFLAAAAAMFLAAACTQEDPTPTQTSAPPEPTATAIAAPEPTATSTGEPEPTATPTETPEPAETEEPASVPEPTPTQAAAPAETAGMSFTQFNLEAYWYSRYILSRHHARSGAGFHMLWGPLFQGDGEKLKSTVQGFSEKTGHPVPTNPWPVFLEFKSAKPYFTQQPNQGDFATLRWDKDTVDPAIETGALGQAATKKIVWIEQFLRSIYDPPENQFIGFVLTGEVLNTFNWLRMNATNTGEPLDPANYQGEYFPHALQVEMEPATAPDGSPMPPKPGKVTITDADSVLGDQWALLWSTTEFKSLAENEDTKQFYDGDPFPAEAGKLATGLSMAVFQNIQSRHWNSEVGTLVDRSHDGTEMGTTTTVAVASRAVNGLANFYKAFQGTPPAQQAERLIDEQAQFLAQMQRADGSLPNQYDLENGQTDEEATTLKTQAEAINALLIAHDITGKAMYRAAAFSAFQWMLDNLWDEEHGVYKNAPNADQYNYTPWEIGAVLGASRNLFLKGDDLAGHRLVEFWDNVVNKSGMIQAELPQTGEKLGDGQADTDGDGIPEPGQASAIDEAPNGVDAVLGGSVRLDPATGTWQITDRTYETEAQMYAANQMYITGIPTFAPVMVKALELRSITPETKTQLVGLEEALTKHEQIMSEVASLLFPSISEPESVDSGSDTGDSAVREITVNASTYQFDPGDLEVAKGETVKFTVTSEDTFHTFSVKLDQDAEEDLFSLDLTAGSTKSVTHTFEQGGTLYLYCKPHETLGMTGKIHVHDE